MLAAVRGSRTETAWQQRKEPSALQQGRAESSPAVWWRDNCAVLPCPAWPAGAALEVERLEGQVAELRRETQLLADDNRGLNNIVHAQERELAR